MDADKFPLRYQRAAQLLENPWFATGQLPFDLISDVRRLPTHRTSLTPLENIVLAGWGMDALLAYWEESRPTHDKFIQWAQQHLQT